MTKPIHASHLAPQVGEPEARPRSGRTPVSVATQVAKLLLALAVTLAGFAVAPAVASAAPAHTGATAGIGTAGKAMPASWTTAPAPVAATGHNQLSGPIANAVFRCNYFARAPFYLVDFTCSVTAGAIQLWVDCSDGRRITSGILAAVGTYNVRATCGPPATVINFGAQIIR